MSKTRTCSICGAELKDRRQKYTCGKPLCHKERMRRYMRNKNNSERELKTGAKQLILQSLDYLMNNDYSIQDKVNYFSSTVGTVKRYFYMFKHRHPEKYADSKLWYRKDDKCPIYKSYMEHNEYVKRYKKNRAKNAQRALPKYEDYKAKQLLEGLKGDNNA